MEKAPNALRRHVAVVGKTNAGKSTLFNALTGQDVAIISPVSGTTTDPVTRAMELIPFGPIVLVDTAGLEDKSELGSRRMEKTAKILRRADAAIYVADSSDFSPEEYAKISSKIPHLLVFNREKSGKIREKYETEYPNAIFFENTPRGVEHLRQRLSDLLSSLETEPESIIADLIPGGGTVVFVIPIDSEAPKGRLILPQVQLMRDCLDNGITFHACRETELGSTLANLGHVDLVVTDSQAFKAVADIVPPTIKLTSFSILLARHKGNLRQFLDGTPHVTGLTGKSRILALEGCTHNHTHEDIGRVKIPALLREAIGAEPQFEYFCGYDFPESLENYDLAVMCGSCMLNRREILSRLDALEKANVPCTNYGLLLARLNGIFGRATEVFG